MGTSGGNPGRLESFAVGGNPTRQYIFTDFSCGDRKNNRCGCVLSGIKIDAVKTEKYDHRCESGTLIAIDKGMIFRDSEPIGRCQNGEIGFPIGELIDRSRQRGFEKSEIAHSFWTAEERKLLGVEIKNKVHIQPTRLAHLASAL